MDKNPPLKKGDKGGFECEFRHCHRLEFLNELLSHDSSPNFINERQHFKPYSKSLEILALDTRRFRSPDRKHKVIWRICENRRRLSRSI